jgi:hypothetical protein
VTTIVRELSTKLPTSSFRITTIAAGAGFGLTTTVLVAGAASAVT